MTLQLTGTVVQGLRSPRALEITVEPSTDVPDLSLVTAASLKVWRRNGLGDVEDWTATITSQSSSSLVLVHPWVDGDNDTPSEHLRVYAQLTIGGEVVECEPVTIYVKPR